MHQKLRAALRSAGLAAAAALIASAALFAGRLHGRTGSTSFPAKCKADVPLDWGEYVGSGQYGIVFKDHDGTLRFVRGFPCGHDGTPTIDLEIRRK